MSCEPAELGTRSLFALAHLHVTRLTAAAVAIAITTAAGAQTDPTNVDPAAAALFHQGRELIAQGDWDAGCEKFRASLARHTSASTVLNLAKCAEHYGKTASAWALYRRARVVNRETRLEKRRRALDEIAKAGIAKLHPTLPRLFVVVVDAPEGVELRESGRSLPLEEAVPLDPGTREITASAPGFEDEKRRVELTAGKTTRVELELTPLPPAPKATPKSAPPAAVGPTPGRDDPEIESREVPTWAWVVGGGGIVATGVAVFFAFDAIDARNQLAKKCGSDLVCNEDPNFDPGPLNSRKNRSIGLAGGLGAAGAIAITASAVAILSVPSSNSTGPSGGVWLAPQSAGGNLRLRF